MPLSFSQTSNIDWDQPLNVSSDFPAFLYPCQIETRIEKRILKIRVFPDQIAISQPCRKLTDQEILAGESFRKASSNHERKVIWRKLANDHGSSRAAWIIHTFETPQTNHHNYQLAKFNLLPDFFLVSLYLGKNKVLRQAQPVGKSLSGLNMTKGENLLSGNAAWIADFKTAQKAGMGYVFKLTNDIKIIRKITVVGIREKTDGQALIQDLLENHHYTTGAGFLKQGTPTNNSETGISNFTREENIELRFEQEFARQPKNLKGSNAEKISWALGLDKQGTELFRKWEHGRGKHDYYTKDFHNTLWTVTGKYFLDTFLKDALTTSTHTKLQKHFSDYVRPAGSLPSFRLGNLPYGLLPVTRLKDWAGSLLDSYHLAKTQNGRDKWNAFDKKLHAILTKLATHWQESVDDPTKLPRVGDTQSTDTHPEEELVKILAMSATSQNYALRPYIDDGFSAWFVSTFKDFLFKYRMESPAEESAKQWVKDWQDLQAEMQKLIIDLSEIPVEKINESLLLKTLAWNNALSLRTPLICSKTNPNDTPENYIPLLDKMGGKAPENASETLLYTLLRRALQTKSGLKPWKLLKRNQEETQEKILHFFNNARSDQEIAQRISDDPAFGSSSSRAYGIRKSLAKRIITARDELPSKKFSSIEEINAIKGVGKDTFHDITNSFSSKLVDHIDYEPLLKGVFDLFTHRLDAWISSLANKRLHSLREKNPEGLIVGAYGFVENLTIPDSDSPQESLATGGFIHAPSAGQATTAALLKSGFLSHSENTVSSSHPYRINLSSDRIRKALQIMQGIREGQDLGALLGYQFERSLHENGQDQYKNKFRNAFPLVALTESDDTVNVETVASRNVVNGLALLRYSELPETARKKIADETINDTKQSILILRDTMDAMADLLMHESVYQAVNGNFERSGAAMDAATGKGLPPELQSVTTPLHSDFVSHRVCILFDSQANSYDIDNSPRESAEPRLATWFESVLGKMKDIGCCVKFFTREVSGTDVEIIEQNTVVTLEQLTIGSLDFLYTSANRPGGGETELETWIKELIRRDYPDVVEGEVPSPEDSSDDSQEQPNINSTKRIEIDFGPYESNPFRPEADHSYSRSLDDALTMAQQVLNSLAQADYLQPENLCHPRDGMLAGFQDDDYQVLRKRAADAIELIQTNIMALQPWVEQLLIVQTVMDANNFVKKTLENTELATSDESEISASLISLIKKALSSSKEIYNAIEIPLLNGIELFIQNNPGTALTELIPQVLELVETQLKTVLTTLLENVNVSSLVTIIDSYDDLGKGLTESFIQIEQTIANNIAQLRRFGIPAIREGNLSADWLQGLITIALQRKKEADQYCIIAEKFIDQIPDSSSEVQSDQWHNNAAMTKAMSNLGKSLKALFGERFIILPTFSIPEQEKFNAYKKDQKTVLVNHQISRIYLWLQQAAQTHTGLQRLEDNLLMTEAWNGTALLQPSIIQLPFQIDSQGNLQDSLGWQALSNKELGIVQQADATLDQQEQVIREKRPRGTMSITTFCEGASFSKKVCGLMIDHWTEELPHTTVNTAVALNADTPNQQPPNCCLLAVPGSRDKENWYAGDLEAIVSDTLDLARLRAVDLDALPDLKGLLPALFLPIQPDEEIADNKKHPWKPLNVKDYFPE